MTTRTKPPGLPFAGIPARPRRGLTLIEAAMVLAVVTLVFAGFVQLLNDASENQRVKTAADRLKEVSKAAEMYVSANAKTIREKVGDNWVAIPVTGGGGFGGLTSLQAAGFLPVTFQDVNSYRQSHTLYLRTLASADPANASPYARRIEAIVTSNAAGSNRIPWRMVGKAAQMVGSQGGFCRGTSSTDTTCANVTGASGGWTVQSSLINAQAGSIQSALFVSDNGFVSDYLNRNNIGNPEANTMRATITSSPLDQNGQPTYAMIAGVDANGQQITELKFGPNISVDGYVKAGNYVQAGNCTPAGNAGTVYGCTNVEAGTDVLAGRNVQAGNDVIGKRFVDSDDPTQKLLVDPSGRSKVKNLNITDMLVTTNDPNDPNDRLYTATDNGASNSGIRLRDLLPRYVAKDGYMASKYNPDIELPVCPNGGQQRVFLSPMQDSFAFDLNKYVKPQISPNYVYNVNGGNPQSDNAVTNVTCDPSGACTQTKRNFVLPDGLTYNQGVTDIGIGQLKHYRQFSAGQPVQKVASDGNVKWFWTVSVHSPAVDGVPNADPEPLDWQALAMTYCYY